MVAPEIGSILTFWLDDVGPDGWYEQSDALDRQITERFGDVWAAALSGAHDDWISRPEGALALLLVLDQFSRNMFRGHADAFRSDARALVLAKTAIGLGQDLRTREPERQFFYLPLMHSEVLPDQERCVRLIMLHMPEHGDNNLPHAIKHREVIRRFGRFPSRNAALGRTDSDAERAYRADGGYMS